jgi:hypothetical protein
MMPGIVIMPVRRGADRPVSIATGCYVVRSPLRYHPGGVPGQVLVHTLRRASWGARMSMDVVDCRIEGAERRFVEVEFVPGEAAVGVSHVTTVYTSNSASERGRAFAAPAPAPSGGRACRSCGRPRACLLRRRSPAERAKKAIGGARWPVQRRTAA